MALDDPGKPEFASWQSYQKFAWHVRHTRRYITDEKIRAFLDTVLATRAGRDVLILKEAIFFRAQVGVDEVERTDEEGNLVGCDTVGFGSARMRPLLDRAMEGRINPSGIPVLYLATTEQTAISEVRPWIGSEISVAQFRVLRDVKMLDLSRGHGKTAIDELTFGELLGEDLPSEEKKRNAVWVDIDNAFSRPVTKSDDAADYVPTQILAELFQSVGYDGVIYRSQFGERGHNLALFDVGHAEPINCAPYQVSGVEVTFKEIGNRWFSKSQLEETQDKGLG
jgi:hypothetical protein